MSRENFLALLLRKRQMNSAFANHKAWCYMNAMWHLTLWGSMAPKDFTTAAWGPSEQRVKKILRQAVEGKTQLGNHPELLKFHWGWIAQNGLGQADAAEYCT